ncbi:MAG: Acg family FMN-binding oxidoreductase [Gaiellaceae bacterium]
MSTLLSPFLGEHAKLTVELEQIRETATELPSLPPAERKRRIVQVLEFVDGRLALHAEAEELELYPAVAHHLRHPLATAVMVFDHELMRERARELREADVEDVEQVQELLYGLHAVLDAHFRKEEQFYLPLLDQPDEAQAVARAMDRIEHPSGEAEHNLRYGRFGFPMNGTPAEKLAWAVEHAVKAPSSHNSQPWRFHVEGDALELRADRARALPVVDPHDRELTISCGAALYFLRAALRAVGETAAVETLPDPADSDLLARVTLEPPAEASHRERQVFWAMRARRTNRLRYDEREVPDELLHDLDSDAAEEGARFAVVKSEEDRMGLAALVAKADRLQADDKRFRRELAAWIHPNRSHSRDGMPASALGISNRLGPLTVRTFDWGRGRAAKDEQLALGSPVLAVLSTDGDEPRDWLVAGQALGRVLLRATVDDVVASFLNQPVEVEELRGEVAALAGGGTPQLVLRMGFGFGAHVQPTPRRPAGDVLA